MSEQTSLQRLIAEPKGKTTYSVGHAFLLHVFWEAPSMDAALRLLNALSKCALATHRDTPCVPTYFFRLSNNDMDLYGEAPKVVKDHKQLSSLIKKLKVGIPRPAVLSEALRLGLDQKMLDLELTAELPVELQKKPVAVEFTELYLDERAFMEHAGSKDYLDGYGAVLNPALSNKAITIRFGTPTQNLVEKILDPILKEMVAPLPSGYHLWPPLPIKSSNHFLLSIDVLTECNPSKEMQDSTVWLVTFPHPYRPETLRFMALFSSIPSDAVFQEISCFNPVRGEIHAQGNQDAIQTKLNTFKLELITLNSMDSAGYMLHDKVFEIKSLN